MSSPDTPQPASIDLRGTDWKRQKNKRTVDSQVKRTDFGSSDALTNRIRGVLTCISIKALCMEDVLRSTKYIPRLRYRPQSEDV